jgi:hypothetical protein
MLDTKTLNEEWQERIKWLFQRGSREVNITQSKRLRENASTSESIRLQWLDQILNEDKECKSVVSLLTKP